MIADMYKRREKYSYIFFICIVLIAFGIYLFQRPNTNVEWFEYAILALPLTVTIITAQSSRRYYNDVKNVSIPDSKKSLLELDHLVLKNNINISIPHLLVFEKTGAYIGDFKPIDIKWWLYPLLFYKKSLVTLFSVKYAFTNHKGEVEFTIKREGFKETTVTVFNQEHETCGTYVQKDLKSIINIKGELINEAGETLLPVHISGMSGDFHLKDRKGNKWAHFYNGYFPHEYTKIFKDVDNDIVELSNALDKKTKTLLIGMISYLFIAQQNRKDT